uniref:Mitochondrial resolvase Ydc2 catalytic domain-containing protein n=1 Tax=viral metagenome TaxID=1070528 RepID=A0A6C0E6Z0_9ZZZZ
MKYLAWDIGIKNLAYSTIDYDPEKKTKTIINWGVINLMDAADEEVKKIHLCCESSAKGDKCKVKAIFLFADDPTQGLCKKHKQMNKYKATNFLDLSHKITCCYQIKDKTIKDSESTSHSCGKTAMFCSKTNLNLSYCKQHLKVVQKKDKFEIYEIKITKKAKAMGQPMLKLAENLYSHLNKNQNDFLDVDEVIIENQPVLKNPTMKSIQILLYSWFVIHGTMPKKINDIHFFSASKKLEAYDDKDDEIGKTVSGNQYQMNKKKAVLYTTEMLKNNSKWKTFFETHKKKDDLADAYLTNCYYIDRKYNTQKDPKKDSKKDIQENTKIDPKVDLQMDLRTEEVKCGEVKKNKNKLMDFFAKKT